MATQNLVGPEDVGARVSFQYELPNGYVGEAVGVFAQWDDAADAYVLLDKHGRLVRIPRAGVRFGKIVSRPVPDLP
jgi:hypothetical protein